LQATLLPVPTSKKKVLYPLNLKKMRKYGRMQIVCDDGNQGQITFIKRKVDNYDLDPYLTTNTQLLHLTSIHIQVHTKIFI